MRKSALNIRHFLIVPFILLLLAASSFAQPAYNKSEFVARRTKLFEKISDGIAIVFAAKTQFYPVKFRQSPDFYYLTGIEEAGAVLVMTGHNKQSILFVPKRTDIQLRADGPGIWQLNNREEFYGLTRVQPIEEFLPSLQFFGSRAKKLYMLMGSQGNVQNAREELDYYEMLEHSQSIVGGLSESKRAIGVVQQMVPQLALTPLNALL
ncbi:MAG TPA: aminopeptidase P N-terminal domain-containing protein, partial [Pyrinomonadaceae bacterium]|nr:aminopeptidase P N-terminal domain-containing protein [Pyrinomonadaceae bacterium]